VRNIDDIDAIFDAITYSKVCNEYFNTYKNNLLIHN
jgi:hypothetical protein